MVTLLLALSTAHAGSLGSLPDGLVQRGEALRFDRRFEARRAVSEGRRAVALVHRDRIVVTVACGRDDCGAVVEDPLFGRPRVVCEGGGERRCELVRVDLGTQRRDLP